MKNILVILFILLWFGNYHIASYLNPDYLTVSEDYGNFVRTRENIMEVMILLLLAVGVLKLDRFTKAMFYSSIVLVGGSISDKLLQGVTTYQLSDMIVVLFAVFVGIYTYRKNG